MSDLREQVKSFNDYILSQPKASPVLNIRRNVFLPFPERVVEGVTYKERHWFHDSHYQILHVSPALYEELEKKLNKD